MAAGLKEILTKCDVKYDLQIQVKDMTGDPNDDGGLFGSPSNNYIIQKGADLEWKETPVTVGELVIPKQATTGDWAVNEKLGASLAQTLGVESDGIDKMFAFHGIMNDANNKPVGEVNTFRAGYY